MGNKINSIKTALDSLGITERLTTIDQKMIINIIDSNFEETLQLLGINEEKENSKDKEEIITVFNDFFTDLLELLYWEETKNSNYNEEKRQNLIKLIKRFVKDDDKHGVKEVNEEEAYLISVIYILLKPGIIDNFITKIVKYTIDKIILISDDEEKIFNPLIPLISIKKEIDSFITNIDNNTAIFISVADSDRDINDPKKYNKDGCPIIKETTFNKMKKIKKYLEKKGVKADIDDSLIVNK